MEVNPMRPGFKIKPATIRNGGFTYETFRLTGWLNGQRIRKNFKSRDEAEGEKLRLEIEAGNAAVRSIITRLTETQVAEAESAITQLAGKASLAGAVAWYLANYRPPVSEMPIEAARDAFLADREPHISATAYRDYKRTLNAFAAMFPKRAIHAFKVGDVETFLKARKMGKKTFNNQRTNLNALFVYACHPARKWATENPVAGIAKFKIARGLPEILTPERCAELMAYVESYRGGERSNLPAGCLVPYFALCLFAGIRPDVREGEIRKLGDHADVAKLIDLKMGVIRILPEISKVGQLRLIKIRANLAAWLTRYPAEKFPLVVPNMQDMVTQVRVKFGLTDDVLRHTFISAHVAAFRSVGDAALEAGNSEAMIKKHYLQLLSEADAAAIWAIIPKAPAEVTA